MRTKIDGVPPSGFVIARKLTYGNLVAIPAIAKTKNTRRYREDYRLRDLDSNQD